jgi:hypothetical protein
MSAITFDTLAYAKKLKKVGFTEEQAEVQAETLADIIDSNLATKRDLKELELNLTIKIGAMLAICVGSIAALVKIL